MVCRSVVGDRWLPWWFPAKLPSRAQSTQATPVASMFHTTIWILILGLPGILGAASLEAQDKPVKASQASGINKVISDLQKREKSLGSVELDMVTLGSYPGGLKFSTRGRLRVLGTTHFHIRVVSTFLGNGKDQLTSEVEKVITPDGVWTRQQGPIEVVYTKMSAALVKRLELAQKALAAADKANSGNQVAVPGLLSEGGRSPLGSAMLVSFDQQFDLRLQKAPRSVGGTECRVFSGPWRVPTRGGDNKDGGAAAEPLGPASAEIVVRPDGVPIALRQFDRDRAITLELRIDTLTLNPALKKGGFVLPLPAGKVFQDVMDHRPSRAQIQRLLDEYEALDQPKPPVRDKPKK